jgi:hypothetical protein
VGVSQGEPPNRRPSREYQAFAVQID